MWKCCRDYAAEVHSTAHALQREQFADLRFPVSSRTPDHRPSPPMPLEPPSSCLHPVVSTHSASPQLRWCHPPSGSCVYLRSVVASGEVVFPATGPSARTADERIAKQPMMPINMALRESDIFPPLLA